MTLDDLLRTRLDAMIDVRHPLAKLAARLPWAGIETALAQKLAHKDLPARSETVDSSFGAEAVAVGGGVSPAGRPQLATHLMIGLLYLKAACERARGVLIRGSALRLEIW